MKVLRVYHEGRNSEHRLRERALAALGVDVTLVVPRRWPGPGNGAAIPREPFQIVEVDVKRPGDVNRHTYPRGAISDLIADVRPDILDVHEEPFSLAARQWLTAVSPTTRVCLYTAQNIDKRFPPPFYQFEKQALLRADGLYPCTRQAASVARGKGFGGPVTILPLGHDDRAYAPGTQAADGAVVTLGFVGRLVPEKGVMDAVRILEAVGRSRPARLVMVGDGPEAPMAVQLAKELRLGDRLELRGWAETSSLPSVYRQFHVLLIPSLSTPRWVEQFGRVIIEAQASGALVAGYRTGSIPEVAGDSALLTLQGDVGQLANKVLAAMENPADFDRRRKEGLLRAAACTWSEVGSGQYRFYEQLLEADPGRAFLPRSSHERRAAATVEFGPTATTPLGRRPFALPVLRNSSLMSKSLSTLLDSASRIREGLVSRLVREPG